MDNIVLISGLDFSGKTTVTLELNKKYKYSVHHKFLSGINYLDEMQKQNRFINDPKDFIPLLTKLICQDIEQVKNNALFSKKSIMFQDTLWPIKYVAKLQLSAKEKYQNEIDQIMNLLRNYPCMKSCYLAVDYDTRLNRLLKNKDFSCKRTMFDKMILDQKRFLELESIYLALLHDLFPNTIYIDTSQMSVVEVAEYLDGLVRNSNEY